MFGIFKIIIFVLAISVSAQIPVQKITAIDSIAHSEENFTQGLFFDGNELWESTGLVGKSKIYKMNKNGIIFDSIAMPANHFGEGIAKIDNKLLWLTWQSRIGLVLSASPLKILGSFKIKGEGWGLTVWNGNFLMSDGSSSLFVLSANDMSITNTINTPINNLNELEVINDTLYANVWHSDSIAVISLPSGKLIKWLDFSEKARNVRKKQPKAEVLNGIAFDGKNIWLTGKNWNHIFKINSL